MWLIQVFDVEPELLPKVETALRTIEGLTIASALRDQHAYIVVEAHTRSKAMTVQRAVHAIDPTAILDFVTEGADIQRAATTRP